MPTTMDPYDVLGEVYDQESHEEVSRAFFRTLRPLLKKVGRLGPVLELGCGTGNLSARLAEAHFCVVGVDRSRRALRVARKRCARNGRNVTLVRSDLATLPAMPKCAAALACGDVVNHILSGRKLLRIFTRARANLQPGGLFAFDSLNRFCFESYWADRTYYMEGASGDLIMECDWNERTRLGTARVVVLRRTSQGYRKSEVLIQEKLYERHELRALLRRARFSNIRPREWSPWSDQAQEPALDRTLWIARP